MLSSLIFLAVLFGTSVAQLQIISTFKNTFLQNGTQGNDTEWTERTLTLRCSNNNFRDTGLKIGDLYWDVNCKPPKVNFETTLREFVPHETRTYTAEICLVPSTASTSTVPSLNPFDNPGRRRLMFWSGIGGVINGITTLGGKAICWLTSSLFGNCAPDPDGPDPHTAAQIEQLQRDIAFINSVNAWQNTTTLALVEQFEINKKINETLQNYRTQLNLLRDNDATIQQALIEQTRIADARDNATREKFVSVYNTLAQGINVSLTYTDQRTNQLEAATLDNFRRILERLGIFVNDTNFNRRRLQDKDRRHERLIRDNDANLMRKLQNVQLRRLMSVQIWELAQQAQADGLIPFFHPGFAGTPPTTATPAQRTVFIELLKINAVTGTAAPFTNHQWGVNLFCNVQYILNRVSLNVDWHDFMEIIGPVGCTALPGEKVDNCRCWIELSHKTCQAASNGNPVGQTKDFNWQDITSQDRNAYTLTPSKCATGSPVTGAVWDGVFVDSIQTFHSFLGSVCVTDLATATGGPTGSGTRKWQMVGTRIGVLNFATPTISRAEICAINTELIFEDQTMTELNLVHAVYRFWSLGFAVLLGDQQIFERQQFGILPSFLTFEEHLFQTLSDNQTYPCYRGSFLAASAKMRAIYSVRTTGITPVAEFTAYAEPPVCGDLGCTFGTPVSVERTSDLTAVIPFDNLLPSSSRAIAGEWRPSGMTTVFNTPEGSVSTSSAMFDRQGKINYVWQPIPDGFNISVVNYSPDPGNDYPELQLLDEWQANNPYPFSHVKGGFSMKITEVPFTSTRCSLPPGMPVEWPCEFFDQFLIDPSTNMRKGLLSANPRIWSMLATMRINEGEITQRVFAGCPEFNFATSENDAITELELRNTLPTPVRAVVRVTYLSSDCENPGDITYTLQPRQKSSQLLSSCGQQIVSVFQILPGGTLRQCESSLNVTLQPNNAANIDRFVNRVTNRSIVTDVAIAQSSLTALAIANLLQDLLPYARSDINTQLTTTQRDAAIQALIDAFRDTLESNKQSALLPSTQTATEALEPFNQRLIANNAQLVNLSATVPSLNENLIRQGALIDTMVVQSADLSKKADALVIANQNLINALESGAHRPGDPCSWCNDKLGFIGKLICPLICPIVNFFISIGQIILYVLIGAAILAICFPAARAFLPLFVKWLGYVFTCGPCRSMSSPMAVTPAGPPLTGNATSDIVSLQSQLNALQARLNQVAQAQTTKVTTSGRYNRDGSDSEMATFLPARRARRGDDDGL